MKYQHARILSWLILLYMSLLCIFAAALYGANLIPYTTIQKNIAASHTTLAAEGYSKRIIPGIFITQLDNFTDAWMINLCHPDSSISAFENTFRDTHYCPVIDPPTSVYSIESLLIASDNYPDQTVVLQYPRYWHGYLSTLRPILTILSYPQIRILNFILLSALAVYALAITFMRRGALCFWALLIALCAAFFPMVPLSLQFSTCFYITLISLSLLLTFPSLTRSTSAGFLSFFAIGAVTVYFDFLTTPLLTLGVPAAIVLYGDRRSLRRSVAWTAAWFAGYAILWMSKWLLAALFLGPEIFHDVFDKIVLRSVGHVPTGILSDYIYNSYTIAAVLFAGVALTLGAAYLSCRHSRLSLFRDRIYLCFLCLPVILWCITLHNQVTVHLSFTWRVISVPVLCGILFIWSIFISKKDESRRPDTML